MVGRGQSVGSAPRVRHQSENKFHLLAYRAVVEGARELAIVSTTAGAQSPSRGSGP